MQKPWEGEPRAYAGVGSRATPGEILKLMRAIAGRLARLNWVLRTGAARGADSAFEDGAGLGRVELFLPWPGFNRRKATTRDVPSREAFELAARLHPRWRNCGEAARNLHARNGHIVLGDELDDPVAFVLCWTEDGAKRKTTIDTGGTGQAIRIAIDRGIGVFNLCVSEDRALWEAFVVSEPRT